MGHSSWSFRDAGTLYASRATLDHTSTADRAAVFDHMVDVVATDASLSGDVNPKNLKDGVRESRDSDAHPSSKAIIVAFDTTGSMRDFPSIFVMKSLPNLMRLLVEHNYCVDPQVCFAAFNDGFAGGHPFQVGQFESGLEMDEVLRKLPLQGGGGGSMEENAELALYFAARHTAIDCYEQRGERGYLFIVTDEKPYDVVNPGLVERAFGTKLQGPVTVEAIAREAANQWEVFVLYADTGSYEYAKAAIQDRWKAIIGNDHVLLLESAEGAAELIAATVGIAEGNVDLTKVKADLSDNASVADSVSTALSVYSPTGGVMRVSIDGDLPTTTGRGKTTRL